MSGQKIDLKGASVMLTHHAGKPRLSVLVTSTCSWCGFTGSKCIAVMRRVGMARRAGRMMPLLAVTHALCNPCFQEYWNAGGADREAA